MLVRRENEADLAAIDEVHRRAFEAEARHGVEPLEVGLVRALRTDSSWVPQLSLVAQRAGRVIGHVVVTRASIAGDAAAGLGPLGVLPAHQRAGVGSALMHAVLGAADALEIPVVVLLGHIGYYPRFGFVPASDLGIAAPERDWGAHFQARPLAAWNVGIRGQFRYAAPFSAM